jgi:hypothetical protein
MGAPHSAWGRPQTRRHPGCAALAGFSRRLWSTRSAGVPWSFHSIENGRGGHAGLTRAREKALTCREPFAGCFPPRSSPNTQARRRDERKIRVGHGQDCDVQILHGQPEQEGATRQTIAQPDHLHVGVWRRCRRDQL